MVQRTVLKVDISCPKCKKKLLKGVSRLQGIDKIEVDAAKSTLTVTGNADPYSVILKARKAGKYAEVVSIGPPPPPPKQDGPKKPDPKKQEPKPEIHTLHTCSICAQMAMPIVHVQRQQRWDEPNPSCSIM